MTRCAAAGARIWSGTVPRVLTFLGHVLRKKSVGARVLLVCSECTHYFDDGQRSAEKLRPSDFAQAAAAMGDGEELLPAARAAGWRSHATEAGPLRWVCPECSSNDGPDAA